MLSMSLLILLAQPGEVAVGATRQEGVTPAQVEALLGAIRAALTEGGVKVDSSFDAFSSCGPKRSCLVSGARKAKLPVIVAMEVGAVLDEADVFVEAFSTFQDGRRLVRVDERVLLNDTKAMSTFRAALGPLVDAALTEVRNTKPAPLAAPATPVTRAEPTGPAAAPAPTNAPVLVPKAEPEPSDASIRVASSAGDRPSARRWAWVPLAVGGLGAGLAVLGFIVAHSTAAELRTTPSLADVRTLAGRGEAFQAVGVAGVGVAVAAVATSVLMFALGAPVEGGAR